MKVLGILAGLVLANSAAQASQPAVPTAIVVDIAREVLQNQLALKQMTLILDSVEVINSENPLFATIKLSSDAIEFVRSNGQKIKKTDINYIRFLAQDKNGSRFDGWVYEYANLHSSEKDAQVEMAYAKYGRRDSATKLIISPYTGQPAVVILLGQFFVMDRVLSTTLEMNLQPRHE